MGDACGEIRLNKTKSPMEGIRLLCALCDKHYKWQSHLNKHM